MRRGVISPATMFQHSQSAVSMNQNQSTKPVADPTDGFVSISIRHEEIQPGVVYELIRISAEDYGKDVLRTSNFDGTTVLSKDQEPLKKVKLDQRLVLSILDQAELEYPGHNFDWKWFTKIRALINDK